MAPVRAAVLPMKPGGRVPLKPSPEPSAWRRRRWGCTAPIGEGSALWLPVEVAGALFSVGDAHAAQGEGEVCGTAIESPIGVALKFERVKAANLKMPRFDTPGPARRHLDGKGYSSCPIGWCRCTFRGLSLTSSGSLFNCI